MTYDPNIKRMAVRMRKEGYSLSEVASKLTISKNTASLWLNHVKLDRKARERIENIKRQSRKKGSDSLRARYLQKLTKLRSKARETVDSITIDKNSSRLLCALLYWAEGAKSSHGLVSFINSDPVMIKTFLYLLRSSFRLDEKKFRGLIHIHEYHDEEEIKEFWSRVSNIPIHQFQKSYLKPHTQRRQRDGYKGTMSVRYYDSKIALELFSIYNIFAERLK